MKNKLLKYITAILSIAAIALGSGDLINVYRGKTVKTYQVLPYPAALQNGSFEDNPESGKTAKTNYFVKQTVLPGWSTTESDGSIELWYNGFTPGIPGGVSFTAQDGVWFVEINANEPSPASALYQDLSTMKGSLYQWSFWHRGRSGTDTAMMLLGPQGTLTTADAQPAAAGYEGTFGAGFTGQTGPKYLTAQRTAWVQHLGYYTANSDITRFLLYSYASSSGNTAMGNLVDNADWKTIASPTTQDIYVGDGTPANSTLVKNLAAGFTISPQNVPDSLTPGTFQVPVKILNSGGTVVGTVTSTVNVLAPVIVIRTLTVIYRDMDGKDLQDPKVTKLNANAPYSEKSYKPGDIITINGIKYQFVKMGDSSDNVSGIMDTDKEIIYIFQALTIKNIMPQTGDNHNTAPWFALITAGGMALISTKPVRKRIRMYLHY